MSTLTTILAFVVAIGTLVTIHELGHYWAARWCNVKILRFSIGFGKTLWLKRVGADQTEWVIAALPLGGFVRMADERDGSATPEDRDRAFNTQSLPKRMFIIIAGPLANFLLAGALYWVVFMMGQPGAVPFVAAPAAGSVAASAGFAEYDKITAIDGNQVVTWGDARLALLDAATAQRTVEIEVETASGQKQHRSLSLQTISKEDLDKDFLTKLGLSAYRPKTPPIVDEVTTNSPAAKAGLKAGDRIVSVDGQGIAHWDEFTQVVRKKPTKPIQLTVESRGEMFSATITPDAITQDGQTIGRIGVTAKLDKNAYSALFTTVRYGPIDAIGHSGAKVWEMSTFSLKMLWRMVTGNVSWKNLSGPLTIADYAGQSARMGANQYLLFLALISISLGVLNLLPIPVLDGGQLLYHIAELIKGSPISEKSLEIGQQLGIALLLGLTAVAFFNDIQRLVSG